MDGKNENANENISDKDLENGTEPNENDDKSQTNGDDAKAKQKQSREENAYYANLRRKNKELEEKNKSLENEVKAADFNARAKTISNDTLSEIGIDKITTKEELAMAEAYEKAVKDDDPEPLKVANKVYRDAIQKTNEELKAKEKAAADHQKLLDEDDEKFFKKYGAHIVDKAFKDEKFINTFGELIKENKGNITKLYGMYVDLTNNGNAEKDDDKKKGQSMGALPNSSSQPPADNSSNKLDLNLSDEDYIKAFNAKYGR